MSSLCNKILFISSFKFIKSWDILFLANKRRIIHCPNTALVDATEISLPAYRYKISLHKWVIVELNELVIPKI